MGSILSKRWLALFLVVLLLFSGAAEPLWAQSVDGWQATYWNNTDLEGSPVLIQLETDQNHNPELRRNWGNWRPWPAVEKDFFSARYERTVELQPGRYRFAAAADDGVRVYVNDQLIIDEWVNQVATTHIGYFDQTRNGGARIRVEYYEYQHDALLTVTWDRVFGSDSAVTGQVFEPTITNWRGEYFNNRIVAGQPDLVRNDDAIDFDWGLKSPAIESINADGFSVRWSRTLSLPAGTYRFKTETDDGVRLYLNGNLRIDQWRNQTFSPHTTDYAHGGGPLKVQMHYYDELGLAQARLTWERIGDGGGFNPATPLPTAYWEASYYNNTTLTASPAVVRRETDIQYDWGTDSPIPDKIIRDAFSARWTGTLNLPAGRYRFTTSSDDGVRLWVNDEIVIDKWRKQPLLVYSAEVDLPGGPVPVVMTYYNVEHKAVAKLDWERLDGELPPGRGLVPLSGGGGSAGVSGGSPGVAVSGSGSDASAAVDTSAWDGSPQVTVAVASLNVRTEASILSEVQASVDRGIDLPILGRNRFNNWLQIGLPDGRLGWVSVLYVQLPEGLTIDQFDEVSNPTVALDDTPGAEEAPSGQIDSSANVVRTEPNYFSDQITRLPVGALVTPIGRNKFSHYVEIELDDGRTGWIGVLFIDMNVPIESLPITEEGFEQVAETLETVVDIDNEDEEADDQVEIEPQASPTPSSSNVSTEDMPENNAEEKDTPTGTATQTPPDGALTVSITRNINMRSGPNTAYDLIGIVPEGSQFIVLNRSQFKDWYFGKIVDTELEGWIWAEFTQTSSPELVEAIPTKIVDAPDQ